MRGVKPHISLKEAKKSLLSFYLVGTVGMLLPWSSPFFQMLIPYSLLLCFILLAFFHQPKGDVGTFVFFVFVFVASYGAEVFGVATGLLFGHYAYGTNLGFKLFGTPVLIGLNWFFLVYTTSALTHSWRIATVWKVVLPSLAMVLYDLVAEQVAPTLGMWSFEGGLVPLQNYLAWFGLALVFHTVLQKFNFRFNNPLSVMLLTLQFVFFVLLMLFMPK